MPRLTDTALRHAIATLHGCAAPDTGVFTVAQALDAGLLPSHVRTLVRRGSWTAVDHGLLVARRLDPQERHLLRCRLALRDAPEGTTISHRAAWLIHELPYVEPPVEPVYTLSRHAGRREPFDGLSSWLPAEHRILYGGLPVTSQARTIVDMLRTATDRGEAQALADGALRAGASPSRVKAVLVYQEGWPGVRQAREAWAHADRRPESALESRSRVWFRDGGLPGPELQAVIDDGGQLVARVDFLFRAQRTVVESDGRLKYDAPGVLWAEKRREDRLRDLGFEVVRATWADGADGGAALVGRVLRAFDRAERRAA